jgi:hypothetical protein
MFILFGALVLNALIAIAILREPDGEAGKADGGYGAGNNTGSAGSSSL